MAFDGSGNFNRVMNWEADREAGIKIRSDRHDQEDDNLAAGLSNCITKDGQSQPLADIPFNSKRIVNLGAPVSPNDAATKAYADALRNFTSSINISGADLNGRVNFAAATGANGLTWTGIDMSLLSRVGEADKTINRLVINDTVHGTAGSSNDVVVFDEAGRINSVGQFTQNLSWDGDQWRTIVPGFGTHLTLRDGAVRAASNDAATITDNYKDTTLHEWFSVTNTTGNITLTLDKAAKDTTEKQISIVYSRAGLKRWEWLTTAHDETGSNAGSWLYLQRYSDAGTVIDTPFYINRANGLVTIGNFASSAVAVSGSASVSGALTVGGNGTFNIVTGNYVVASASIIAGGGGLIRLRPNGYASAAEEVLINSNGDLVISELGGLRAGYGLQERTGQTGGYGTEWVNFLWSGTGTSTLYTYRANQQYGPIAYTCDYRAKENVKPLGSVWDKVKALRPVSFTWRDWEVADPDPRDKDRKTTLSKASDEPQWGFIAHELQEDLLPSAASGRKDEEKVVQGPNLLAVIAALTGALQEAMARIEALEAAA